MSDQPTPQPDTEPASEPQTRDSMVAALLREREGYVQRGLDDRVAQVDEQLRFRGHEPPTGKDAQSSGRSTPPKGVQAPPKGRQAPRRDTT